MDVDKYYNTKDERQAKYHATTHGLHPHTCDYIRKVYNEVLFAKKTDKPLDLNIL